MNEKVSDFFVALVLFTFIYIIFIAIFSIGLFLNVPLGFLAIIEYLIGTILIGVMMIEVW